MPKRVAIKVDKHVADSFDMYVLGGVHYSRLRTTIVNLTSRASVTLTCLRAHYVVGVTVYLALSHCCLICVCFAELCIVIVLIRFLHRVLQMSDSTAAAAAFNRKNVGKK
jgi:hypothetical protein